jgi:hypothetical protein
MSAFLLGLKEPEDPLAFLWALTWSCRTGTPSAFPFKLRDTAFRGLVVCVGDAEFKTEPVPAVSQ